jgi:hypothetical protein
MKIKNFLLSIVLMCSISLSSLAQQASVKRVILFIIDGISIEAPSRLNMPTFNELIKNGTYIPESYVIVPHHPTVGSYSEYNTCSFPNPLIQQGTLFLSPKNKMVQELFPKGQTALVVNAIDYKSLSRGFSTAIQDVTMSDADVVNASIRILQDQHPVFMRIHLQAPGTRGFEISQSAPDKPYCRNIFGQDSPYVKAIENADKLLGKFISFLKKEKLSDSTVLIVTGDHGENKTGWHSLYNEECWRTPLLFVGADIAQGRRLSYFEQTDIAPTIAGLLGKDGPNHDGASGKFVKEILKDQDASNYHPNMYLKRLDGQIRDFNFLRAELITSGKQDDSYINVAALLENGNFGEPFYSQDRILDWYKAGTIQHLLEVNQKVLDRVRSIMAEKKTGM